MVDSNEYLLLTNYLKNNEVGLGNFAKFRLKASHFEALKKYVVSFIQEGNCFVDSQAKIQADILQVGPTPESNSNFKCILDPKRFWDKKVLGPNNSSYKKISGPKQY